MGAHLSDNFFGADYQELFLATFESLVDSATGGQPDFITPNERLRWKAICQSIAERFFRAGINATRTQHTLKPDEVENLLLGFARSLGYPEAGVFLFWEED